MASGDPKLQAIFLDVSEEFLEEVRKDLAKIEATGVWIKAGGLDVDQACDDDSDSK